VRSKCDQGCFKNSIIFLFEFILFLNFLAETIYEAFHAGMYQSIKSIFLIYFLLFLFERPYKMFFNAANLDSLRAVFVELQPITENTFFVCFTF